ncbi:MAG: mechanosensitive ion channel family protein [Opitutaceae bacterium]|jgi:MscS family membrane protein
MKRVSLAFFLFFVNLSGVWAQAGGEGASDSPPVTTVQDAGQTVINNDAAGALAMQGAQIAPAPQFLEHVVDIVLELCDVKSSGNTWQRYAIAAGLLILFYLLRKVVTTVIFSFFRVLASRTKTTLDDKLFPALEPPVATFIALFGVFAALKVLKLSPVSDEMVSNGATVAFSLSFFWLLMRAVSAVLDHMQEVAKAREASVAAFMPWIKKAVITFLIVFGLLMTAQSLHYDVKAFLAGLGIGGLAFALAAQDTIANLFGSVVVAIDQPFKLGEFVRIGSFLGAVEDIGLRSTRLRSLDKSLIIIPNKTVAAEAVTNLSRFTQRRNEQVIGLTYDTPVEKMEVIVEEIKDIIKAEEHIDQESIMVYFRDYSASSLDIWIVYVAKDGDFQHFMRVKQRINLNIMRAVQVRGLSFAFPTQTLEFGESAAKALAARRAGPDVG